jgi:transcriptional regulator with XRE-family HTH domain
MIREEHGIAQAQLAEATGFIQPWISHLERGARNPSWNNVVRLAAGRWPRRQRLGASSQGRRRMTGKSR